jgi:hypothetical protein
MSWAETQHPETTLASQSLLKTGFRRADQMEVEFVLIREWAEECRSGEWGVGSGEWSSGIPE